MSDQKKSNSNIITQESSSALSLKEDTSEANQAIEELAGRIYDLDKSVYETLGSSLGRVFYRNREESIQDMMENMKTRSLAHVMRTELALIGNMIRTIDEEDIRRKAVDEYYSIMAEIEKMPESYESADILNKKMARVNEIGLKKRFKPKDHLVICISRTYGCMGSTIGFKLAEKLNINYYDVEIFNKTAERMNVSKNEVSEQADFPYQLSSKEGSKFKYKDQPYKNQSSSFSISESLKNFNTYHGLPKEDAVFFNQSELICDMAKKEDFVVMGRCAHVILSNKRIPHVSIFITAPMNERIKHIMTVNPEISRKKAEHILKVQDEKHKKYYKYFTGREWGSASNYDLCINSAAYGLEGSLNMIMKILPSELAGRHSGEGDAVQADHS